MELTELMIGTIPWLVEENQSKKENNRVIFQRIGISRNISGESFVNQINDSGLSKLSGNLMEPLEGKGFNSNQLLKKCRNYEISGLYERFLLDPVFYNWNPSKEQIDLEERYLVWDEDKPNFCLINMGDHMNFLRFCSSLSAADNCKEMKILKESFQDLSFSKNQEFGYLLSDPVQSGSGFHIGALIHLPGVFYGGYLENFVNSTRAIGLQLFEIGALSTKGGIFWMVSRDYFNTNEEEFCRNFEEICIKYLQEETKVSEKLYQTDKSKIEDKVFRALAILNSARQLTYFEFFEYASWVKWGVYLGLINEKIMQWLDVLMVKIGPGHLHLGEERELTPLEQDVNRATTVRLTLNGVN